MLQTFAFLDLGTPQLIIILAIVLLLFGSKKLPELSRSIGESVSDFKKSADKANDFKGDLKKQALNLKQEINGVSPAARTDRT